MAIVKSGSARYEGLGKDGKGHVSTQSGALDNQPYGFQTRFEDKAGTNPEELIAAAHASCFTMALSFKLAKAACWPRIERPVHIRQAERLAIGRSGCSASCASPS